MAKKNPKAGFKFSNGHEVRIGHRWDVGLGKAVKETRGGKPAGPTARTQPVSFGMSQLDRDNLKKTLKTEDVTQSTLLYQFFREGMLRLKGGKCEARKKIAPARPVVVVVSVNHIDDLEMVQEAWKLGAVVIAPELNSAQVRRGLPDRLFDDATTQFVRKSDAVLFGKGALKTGAELKAEATANGVPTFSTLAQLAKWMSTSRKAA